MIKKNNDNDNTNVVDINGMLDFVFDMIVNRAYKFDGELNGYLYYKYKNYVIKNAPTIDPSILDELKGKKKFNLDVRKFETPNGIYTNSKYCDFNHLDSFTRLDFGFASRKNAVHVIVTLTHGKIDSIESSFNIPTVTNFYNI